MKLKVISSGSHGNCYLLQNGKDTLILECGVKFKKVQQTLDYDMSSVCACLVTHEHQDHCKAIKDVVKAGVDCYMSTGTAQALNLTGHRTHHVKAMKQIQIGKWSILPFDTEHDATEPLGYLVYHTETRERLVFATDTYYIRNRFSCVNYIMVECNYIPDVLQANVEAGNVPSLLKNRLLQSHFSLDHCKDFLKANVTTDTRKIVLLHLSEGNSDKQRMISEIEELTGVETVVAESDLVVNLELYPF